MNNLQNINNLTVLAIESSCDETACAIVRNGREVVSNVVATQIEIHRRFGGVVPEIASRNHTLAIETVVKDALAQANMTKDDIDAVAVTCGAFGRAFGGRKLCQSTCLRLEKTVVCSVPRKGAYCSELH